MRVPVYASLLVLVIASCSLHAKAQRNGRREVSAESLVAALGSANDPVARANASHIGSTLTSTRAAVDRSTNDACKADARAHVDAVVRSLREYPEAARYAVASLLEVLLRLRGCEAASCEATPDIANAHARALIWLSLEGDVPPPRGTAPFFQLLFQGERSRSADPSAARFDAFAAAASTATCPVLRADALRRRATLQRTRGQFSAARRTIEGAFALLPSVGASRVRGDLLLERGGTYAVERDFAQAVSSYEQARAAYAELGADGALWTALASTAFAVALSGLGRVDEAIELNTLAMGLRTPLLGEAHRDVLGNAMNIAVLNGRIGNDVAALDAYRRLHDVAGRVLAPHDAMRAAALEGMASALVRLARAAEALPLCQQAVQIRTAHGVAADIARARVCMADAYLGLGRPDLAVVEARAAEQIATATLGPSHPDRARYQEVVATCEARMRAR